MFEPLLMSALCDSFCYIAADILYLGVHYVRYISFDKRFEPQG